MPASTTGSEVNTSLIASTLVHREKKVFDAVTKQLALFWWLKRKGQYKPKTGRRLEWPVWYKNSPGELSYQGFDEFNLGTVDDVTLAYANWKHYHESMVWSGINVEVENTGPEQVFSLMEHKEKAMITRLRTKLSTDFYSDGTGNSGKDITGLDASVPENPATGTLFGFNRATAGNEFMRSILVDQGSTGAAVAAYSGTPTVYPMIKGMETIWQQCGRLAAGGESQRHPDVALCSEGYTRAYRSIMVAQGRTQLYTDAGAANAGFPNVMYNTCALIADQDCPIDRTNTGSGQTGIYLNSEYIELAYSPKRNFKVVPVRLAWNQDVYAGHVFYSGELLLSILPKHGRHIGIKEV